MSFPSPGPGGGPTAAESSRSSYLLLEIPRMAVRAPARQRALPATESITADTDIRAFLAPGIPAHLTRAALRRAWAADPAIRDFVGLAENATTLATELNRAGYSTNYIGKWHLAPPAGPGNSPEVSGPVKPQHRGGFTGLWEAANALQ